MHEGKIIFYNFILIHFPINHAFWFIRLILRFHVDLRPYPIILRIDRELESHPAFRAAHPSNQPDCPPEAAK